MEPSAHAMEPSARNITGSEDDGLGDSEATQGHEEGKSDEKLVHFDGEETDV